eukprot:s47_g10.t1
MSFQQALCSASRCRDAEKILRVIGHESVTPIQVATASHRLAKTMMGSSEASRQAGLKKLTAPIYRSLAEFGPQAAANTLWALAKLSCKDSPLLQNVCGKTSQLIPLCTGRHLSNVAWSMATLSQNDAMLLSAISLHMAAPTIRENLSNQSIANTLWSFAVLDAPNLPLICCLMETVASSRYPINSQDVSNILWAIAPETANLKCEVVWRPFTAAIAQKSQEQAAELPVQELVSVAWAFADVVASAVETPRPRVSAPPTASGSSGERHVEHEPDSFTCL